MNEPLEMEAGHQAMSAVESKQALAQRLRRCRTHNIIDQTGSEPGEVAIYTLSDPRDVQAVRYVGQTRNPPSRYSQHINAARLWLPEDMPWWIKREELRPLYAWIRALHADDQRLPMMYVVGWTTREHARSDERRFVRTFVVEHLALLNQEAATFGKRRQKVMAIQAEAERKMRGRDYFVGSAYHAVLAVKDERGTRSPPAAV